MKYLISTPGQLSQALRNVRKAHGLSQNGVGKLVGLLPKTISALDLELVIAPKRKANPENQNISPSVEDW